MEIEIYRKYAPKGTNGTLKVDSEELCFTIELPWKENKTGISCIPEGKYEVKKRFSEKYGKHLIVCNVPDRELILFHPANNAITELRGCISPVSKITGDGTGILSRLAFNKLRDLAYSAIKNNETVTLTIRS